MTVVTKVETPQRDNKLDFFKGSAMIAILLWHFGALPTVYFIWAIPTFVFTTAALYQNKIHSLSFRKICTQALWVFGIILSLTCIGTYIGIPKVVETPLVWTLSGLSKYVILRNPYLGELWYFVLYFQELFLLLLLSKAPYQKLRTNSYGLVSFLFGLCSAYALFFTVGFGVTFSVFSWTFFIWLGLFRYNEISRFTDSLSTVQRILSCCALLLSITTLLYLGNGEYLNFLTLRTHDPLLPTLFLQVLYLYLLFIISSVRTFAAVNYTVALVGYFSLYFYLFHYYTYNKILEGAPFTLVKGIVVVVVCLLAGYCLESIRYRLFKKRIQKHTLLSL